MRVVTILIGFGPYFVKILWGVHVTGILVTPPSFGARWVTRHC